MRTLRPALLALLCAPLCALLAFGCSDGPDGSNKADGGGDGSGGDGSGVLDGAGDGAGEDAADDGLVGDGNGDASDSADSADTQTEPVACKADEACNRALDAGGLCHGACLPQPRAPHCPRTPLHGLCHQDGVVEPATVTVTVGDIVVSPVDPPATAKTGDIVNVVYALQRKPGGAPGAKVTAQVLGKAGKHWALWGIGQGQAKSVEVGDTPVLVTVAVRAVGWDLLDHAHEVAVLTVNGVDVPTYTVLSFAGANAITCGDFAFPPQFNGCDEGPCSAGYPQGRCCGGVFYPSAACCVDSDCPIGVCADGRCIRRVPDNPTGRSLISGHLRVLWVVADEPGVGGPDLCTDRTEALRSSLGLPQIEGIFADMLQKRLGPGADVLVPLALQWKVLAGLHQTPIGDGDEPTFDQWRQTVKAALQQQGCADTDFADFDVVILSRPKLYLEGYAGHVYGGGFVGLRQIAHPRLTAHEMMHTFGASDLYGDIAVQLQWSQALMGTNTSGDSPLGDDVAWAEVGLADINRDGVIDLAQYASQPESLQLASARAWIDKGPALYIRAEIGAQEAGKARALYYDVANVSVELADAGEAKTPDSFTHTVGFEGAVLDKVGAAIGSKIKVRVQAKHAFTGAGFTRTSLALDTTVELVVEAP